MNQTNQPTAPIPTIANQLARLNGLGCALNDIKVTLSKVYATITEDAPVDESPSCRVARPIAQCELMEYEVNYLFSLERELHYLTSLISERIGV